MLAGFEIAKKLKEICRIIELYPPATIRRLLPAVLHKVKEGVAAQQLNALVVFTGWPKGNEVAEINLISSGDFHDKVDAYSAAWVASLPELKNMSSSLIFERNTRSLFV